jgi:hypothetical protein
MIWFDRSLKRVEREEWVFAEAPQAFIAVRIARGGGTWRADSVEQRREGKGRDGVGEWWVLNDAFSPVILEVARAKAYVSFDAFQSDILANALTWNDTNVVYRSEGYGTTLTLPLSADTPPLIDGTPVNLAPTRVYDSPFLKGDFGTGVMTIQKGANARTLDFTER